MAQHLRPGSARSAAVDDLPGHHRGDRAADPRARRPHGRARTSSSATRPSGWTPATSTSRCATRRSSSRGSPPSASPAPSCCSRRSSTPSCRSRAPMVAETAKLHENTFRAVNIALANELALMCDRLGHLRLGGHRRGVDQAFRVPPALPGAGPGRGLHPGRASLPRLAPARVRLLGAADRGRARDQRPDADLRGAEGRRRAQRRRPPDQGLAILLLGMAYKADVHDTRESPSLEVMRQLAGARGRRPLLRPWVEAVDLDGERHVSREWTRRGWPEPIAWSS